MIFTFWLAVVVITLAILYFGWIRNDPDLIISFEGAKRMLPTALRSSIGRSIRVMQRKADLESVGRDFISDVANRLPNIPIRIVFDVGANIGITALEFSDTFPTADVYAFEPVPENFQRMQVNLRGKPDIRKFEMALGADEGSGYIHIDPENMTTCSIVEAPDSSTLPIKIETLDNFCADNGVTNIDLLKIDTEGHELQVLSGANKMLSDGRIAIIKLECAVDPDSSFHTQFSDICQVLHPKGYRLFGLYDQYECWQQPKPRLRRFDAAFVSKPAFENRKRRLDWQNSP